jgi:hypothetical protein
VSEPRFIGEPIDVTTSGEVKQPQAFVWCDQQYVIVEVMQMWSDWGFAQGAPQRNWRTRHHRNYYRIRTESDAIFEIYNDRGIRPGQSNWYLLQEIDDKP